MRYAALVLTLAACHVPADFHGTHYQCPDGVCPAGYTCVADQCVVPGSGDGSGPPADSGPGDSRIDAPPDAPAACIAALAVNQEFVCAVPNATGAVHCWGRGDNGQLGDGMGTNAPMPTTVTGVTSPISVAVGGRHALAIAGGKLVAWGFDGQGQLGDHGTAEQDTPITVSGAPAFVEVAAGARGSCGMTATGAVSCWGCVAYLADSMPAPHCMTTQTMIAPVMLPHPARQLVIGGQHACALLDDGSVWCWGRNGNGQLGNGSTTDSVMPVQAGITGATAIAAGRRHTCAIAAGSAYCWGDNTSGQIGDNTSTERHTPTKVDLANVTQISAGGHHSCAIAGGVAYCWGANDYGQIGNGTSGANVATPARVQGLAGGVIEARAGTRFTCARDAAGVECWGWNMHGTLGSLPAVDTLPHVTPAAVPLGCP